MRLSQIEQFFPSSWIGTSGPNSQLTMRRGEEVIMKVSTRKLPPGSTSGPDWVQLFNGKDLTGWSGSGVAKVDDGKVVLLAGSDVESIKKMPRHFHLRMEVKLAAGEGKIRIHAPPRDQLPLLPNQKPVPHAESYWYFEFDEQQGTPGKVGVGLHWKLRGKGGFDGQDIAAGFLANYGEWFVFETIVTPNLTEVLVNGHRCKPINASAPAAGILSLSNSGRGDSHRVPQDPDQEFDVAVR